MAVLRAYPLVGRGRAGGAVPQSGPGLPAGGSHRRERRAPVRPTAVGAAAADARLHLGATACLPVRTQSVY